MKIPVTHIVTVAAILAALVVGADALGSAATVSITAATGTVCGILAGAVPRRIHCATVRANASSPLFPNVSFDSVAGARDFLCGLRSGGRCLLCWPSLRRIYFGATQLRDVTAGVDHVAAVEGNSTGIGFWRGDGSFPRFVAGGFRSLTSGRSFSCGIGVNDGRVSCWGSAGDVIQRAFENVSMSSIIAGESHVCGLDSDGVLLCKGGNDYAPSGERFEFSSLALGANHSCAIRRPNGTVLCWDGVLGNHSYSPARNTSFEFLVAGGGLTCGLTTVNFSVVCWGVNGVNPSPTLLPIPRILPGICVEDQTSCQCGLYPDSTVLCSGSGVICSPCNPVSIPSSPSPAQSPSPSPNQSSKQLDKWWLAFAIVGSVGCFAGACSIAYCIWVGVCRQKKIHNSVQPTISTTGIQQPSSSPSSNSAGRANVIPFTTPRTRSRIFGRQTSRPINRQRSGPSRTNPPPFKTEEFTLADLAEATKTFSLENKIGAGSFGVVYKGKLPDGREVAIKRSEQSPRTRNHHDRESEFRSELAFLPRLHHKHLVGLIGFCEEGEERVLVYEFMKNGALYDHLHVNVGELDLWKSRIGVLLDAARGVEYLHNYAVPNVIHRDIKSSNILLDENWTARVSDFGLSIAGPEAANGGDHVAAKAAGTVGYMDPEYYGMQQLTAKSDVYSFGVVMLEVLTGKRAIFKDDEEVGAKSVVDFAVPSIIEGEVGRVVDPRVGAVGAREKEAVELVGYTAVHCVRLEGRERPAMSDVVGNLEAALALCDDSGGGGSISSGSIRSLD